MNDISIVAWKIPRIFSYPLTVFAGVVSGRVFAEHFIKKDLPPDQQLVRANRRNMFWRTTHSVGDLLEEQTVTWTARDLERSIKTRSVSRIVSYPPLLLCSWKTMQPIMGSVRAVLVTLRTIGLIPKQQHARWMVRRLLGVFVETIQYKNWSNKEA